MEFKGFRTLNADEIECRVSTVSKDKKGVSCLLYKDSRCDMDLLDETFGPENWQRKHYIIRDTMICSIGVKFGDEWIWKDDAGEESNVSAKKGEASDSFKRAATNWGIGRELYTAPFIWINLRENEDPRRIRFCVKSIGYDSRRRIDSLIISDDKGHPRFRLGDSDQTNPQEKPQPKPQSQPRPQEQRIQQDGNLSAGKTLNRCIKVLKQIWNLETNEETIDRLNQYNHNLKIRKGMTEEEAEAAVKVLTKWIDEYKAQGAAV